MEFKDRGGGFSINIDNRTILDRMESILIKQAKEKFDIKLLSGELLYTNDEGKLYIWDRTRPYSDIEFPIPEAQKWFTDRLTILRETLADVH